MGKTKEIDCRGLACPQPVIATKEALNTTEKGESLAVLVDNEVARDNVSRLALSQGCQVDCHPADDDCFLLSIKKSDSLTNETTARPVAMIASATMGHGDDGLGAVLMRGFIKSLSSLSPLPSAIYFYNSGVRLTTSDSDLLPALNRLLEDGVKIYSCGTCLDYLGLKSELKVGEIGNMYDIIEAMATATAVLRP